MANAIKILEDEHNAVNMLCSQMPTIQNGARAEEEKAAVRIVSLLKNHTALEEELVYPVLAESHPEFIELLEDEHEEANHLVAEIEAMPPDDELREAVMRLHLAIQKHVAEEEEKLFPLLNESLGRSGLEDLGLRMMHRQQELMQATVDQVGASATGQPKNIYPKL